MELSHFDRYPTVEELLKLPGFSGSRVCGGHAGLDRLVRGVNLTDTPDYSRWLSAGELLITTGFSIAGDQQAVDALLPTAERCGLSGVCIKGRADICRMLCLPGWWRRQTGCPFR